MNVDREGPSGHADMTQARLVVQDSGTQPHPCRRQPAGAKSPGSVPPNPWNDWERRQP